MSTGIYNLNISECEGRPVLKKACTILENGHSSVSTLHRTFKTIRANKKGAPTDEDQDLLRAMFVFAASSLDSVVKQLINDGLAAVINLDVGAYKQFESYIERRLRRQPIPQDSKEETILNTKFLASALASRSPQKWLIEDLIQSLIGDSLQSKDQLFRAAGYLAITKEEITNSPDLLDQAFSARNEIIHEMDIDFSQRIRTRRSRPEDKMVDYSNKMLETAQSFIKAVNRKFT